jgi:hypothetical protein
VGEYFKKLYNIFFAENDMGTRKVRVEPKNPLIGYFGGNVTSWVNTFVFSSTADTALSGNQSLWISKH